VAGVFGDRTTSLFGVTAKNLAILTAFSAESRLETRGRSRFTVLQSNWISGMFFAWIGHFQKTRVVPNVVWHGDGCFLVQGG
jgi:hypothetical protein